VEECFGSKWRLSPEEAREVRDLAEEWSLLTDTA
jgi:hypothetical protein